MWCAHSASIACCTPEESGVFVNVLLLSACGPHAIGVQQWRYKQPRLLCLRNCLHTQADATVRDQGALGTAAVGEASMKHRPNVPGVWVWVWG